jgi:hypothetical protein
MKKPVTISQVFLYVFLITFIGGYFRLDLPLGILLRNLAEVLPIAIIGGILSVIAQNALLKKVKPPREE